MGANMHFPIVGIPCDVKEINRLSYQMVGVKYITALSRCAEVFPVLLPVGEEHFNPDMLFSLCDGIFLTGSHTNVHPDHYGGDAPRESVLLDEARDSCTLPLIRACVEKGMPLFCVCRGFQEFNVAFGGTLHQHLHESSAPDGYPDRFDHRAGKQDSQEVQYGPAHEVTLKEGGFLASLLKEEAQEGRIMVNSLHSQGVDKPASNMRVEALAEDGTIEALHIADAPAFALGVQWHPEWRCWENSASMRLYGAFGDAVRDAAEAKMPPTGETV
ncbi:MAG: gamma-glutamyl-gamma-aminobutyrate hydrolase family protein [Hyphomicrobiales bacterium]|nr:gamma-glutamyl-gamma-aminobutyrate hydrolase family protein [Hyphomicrobiales bacterium]